jgi:hypothetical protein
LTQLRWSRKNRRRCWIPSQNTSSRKHLDNGTKARKGANARKGTTSRVMMVSRPKVSFLLNGNTSPHNYGWLSVCFATLLTMLQRPRFLSIWV